MLRFSGMKMPAPGSVGTNRVAHAGISLEPIDGSLMLLPVRPGEARLVWNFQIHTLDKQHMWDLTVDAEHRPGLDALRLGGRRSIPRVSRGRQRARTTRRRCRRPTAARWW